AIAAGDKAFKIIGRLLCDDIDGTTRSVPAVERALRTLEDLDALNVIEVHLELLLVVLRHTIDHDGDRRVSIVELRNTAHGDKGVQVSKGFVKSHVRHKGHEITGAFDPGVFNGLRREGRYLD